MENRLVLEKRKRNDKCFFIENDLKANNTLSTKSNDRFWLKGSLIYEYHCQKFLKI